jgi:glycosyltransferase involved in cell wall biosynthesis
MFHSIIIPHRNRLRHIGWCLESIVRSAEHCNVSDYEILVIDNGSDITPLLSHNTSNINVVIDQRITPVFNKPQLLNLGIEKSKGEIISFIDADMIVGKDWIRTVDTLTLQPHVSVVAHRVRKYPGLLDNWESIDQAFIEYERYPLAHEGYGQPERNKRKDGPIFGNSQWSIRRNDLGNLRFNEEFAGHGFEDLWFMREFYHKIGDNYQGFIPQSNDEGLLHIEHSENDNNWNVAYLHKKNRDMYYDKKR